MKILLIGGSGTGKTTLAHRLSQEYDVPYVSGSEVCAIKPYSWKKSLYEETGHDIFHTQMGISRKIQNHFARFSLFQKLGMRRSNLLTKNEFLKLIAGDIPTLDAKRKSLDIFTEILARRYGDEIFAEMVLNSTYGRGAVVDNMPREKSVERMKHNDYVVVGLDASYETRKKRILQRRKPMDDFNRVEKSMQFTDRAFQLEQILKMSDILINTDCLSESEVFDMVSKDLKTS